MKHGLFDTVKQTKRDTFCYEDSDTNFNKINLKRNESFSPRHFSIIDAIFWGGYVFQVFFLTNRSLDKIFLKGGFGYEKRSFSRDKYGKCGPKKDDKNS